MPNVIMLMSDEHNPFVSSLFNHPLVKTPNMERMAMEGTHFQNAYCPSPLCLPSRAAFMAGKRAHTLQTYNNCIVNMNPNHKSYAKALTEQGVHTVHIGKTDAYDKGENLGFSEILLASDRTAYHLSVGRDPLPKIKGGQNRAQKYGPVKNPWTEDLERMDRAIQWLKETGSQLKKPFVLSIALIKPHCPHYVTEALWDAYPAGDLPKYGSDVDSARHPHAQALRHYFDTEQFSEKDIRGLRRGYYGCVHFIDEQLGRLMKVLEETGLNENSNLIYTSDHGEMLGKFGMWWKSSLYEDSVRVPCLAMGPSFKRNHSVTTAVDLFDVQASFFKATGSEQPQGFLGSALQDIPEKDSTRPVFSEYHGHGVRESSFMLRQGDWKLIYYPESKEHQVFNLRQDPDELTNLFQTEPEKAQQLEQSLRQICSPEQENARAAEYIKLQIQTAQELNLSASQ